METKYNLSHAREILEPCGVLGNYLDPDESGVWPAIERDLLLLPETEGLRWRPSRELQHLPNAPEVNDTPMLPNPFNARELAAFMLEGVGALVADFYGDWSDGPDPDRLSAIDPDSKARRAVTEAFAAHRWAREQVGELDRGIEASEAAARKAYQNSPRDRELLQAFRDADAAWNAAYQTWLTAMVVCLLEKPQAATTAPAVEPPAPAQTTAAPVPVVADSASDAHVIGPPPVATRRIAFAFDGLRGWNEQAWKDTLGSPPKWLQACIVFRGQQGVRETHWNPVLIGAALVHNGHAKQNSVRARFQSRPQLEGWKEAWKTYEADNFDTQ